MVHGVSGVNGVQLSTIAQPEVDSANVVVMEMIVEVKTLRDLDVQVRLS